MDELNIPATIKTPEVKLQLNGAFNFKGNSYPENATEFYEPITNWLDSFFKVNTSNVNLTVDLKYVNTSSIKSLLNTIIKIRSSSNSTVKIAWIYEVEDDDMLATGEDLQKLAMLQFEFIEKN
ncbi:MAG: DUF1987 domain-containing protein [Bacteroidota bacterium]|nr:DUF1987 domain-containing protein [Bacteroidota bacterium]